MTYLFILCGTLAGMACGFAIARLARPRRDVPAQLQRETLARLQTVAKSLASDVGDHNVRVQQIADSLMEKDFSESADVLLAVREILEASDTLKRRLGDAEKRLGEQAEMLHEQAKVARTDGLTQILNRRALDERLQLRLEALRQRQEPTSLMLLDVDHFKKFNDSYGHLAGDEALKTVAQALVSASGDAFVARYGGEEFAVVYSGMNAESSRLNAELARANVGQAPIRHRENLYHVTASAGLAQLRPGESIAEWIRRADEALYESKKRGRDRGLWRSGDNFVPLTQVRTETKPARAPVAEKIARPESVEERVSDPITGLRNREAFDADLRDGIAVFRRDGGAVTAMLIRLDGFSTLVEKCGFRAAEVALKTTTQFLRATMRETDRIGRYDQDTFALLMPDADLDQAGRIAERLRVAIGGCSVAFGRDSVSFTISCALTPIVADDAPMDAIGRCREALESFASTSGDVSVVHDGRESYELTVAPPALEPVAG